MKESIRQLALQAGFAHEPNKDQLWVGGPTELMISPGLEKFAKLIVYECMDLALGSSHREDDMGAIIANKIKQHFGVEE